MPAKALNRRFFLLQAIMMLIDCITVAYISPILVSFGYSKLQIGQVMTLGALAATLARPLWGFLNDRFSCAKQVTLGGTAVGISCYFLLTWGGGQMGLTTIAVMGLYITVVCMMNFVDSWALRLINGGASLNYGATRAGGSLSYALGAAIFGMVVSRWGFRPGNVALWVLWILMCVVALSLPNPPPASHLDQKPVTLLQGFRTLRSNRVYWVMLAALFLCTLASGSMESFYSVLILSAGGTEQHVGFALFLQATSELPVMFGYSRLRSRLHLSAAPLMAVSMLCYALKALTLASAGSLNIILVAALFQALSFALFTPACVDFMLETVPGEYLAMGHLLFLAIGQGIGAVAGNALSGILSEYLGMAWMFRTVGFLALLASVLACCSAKMLKRRNFS